MNVLQKRILVNSSHGQIDKCANSMVS